MLSVVPVRWVKSLTQFMEAVRHGDHLVDFVSRWYSMAPGRIEQLDGLRRMVSAQSILIVDLDGARELMSLLEVVVLPTAVVFRQGQPRIRWVGRLPEEALTCTNAPNRYLGIGLTDSGKQMACTTPFSKEKS